MVGELSGKKWYPGHRTPVNFMRMLLFNDNIQLTWSVVITALPVNKLYFVIEKAFSWKLQVSFWIPFLPTQFPTTRLGAMSIALPHICLLSSFLPNMKCHIPGQLFWFYLFHLYTNAYIHMHCIYIYTLLSFHCNVVVLSPLCSENVRLQMRIHSFKIYQT